MCVCVFHFPCNLNPKAADSKIVGILFFYDVPGAYGIVFAVLLHSIVVHL